MNKFEWRGFTPTPGEKHAGIAEVKVHGDTPIVLRFKIVPRKDGSGHFPNIASYKMPDRMPGEEYDECFMLDSRSDHDACIKLVMHGFSEWQKSQHPSVFTPQHAYNGMGPQGNRPQATHAAQQNPNYGQAPQQSVPFIQRPEYQQGYQSMPELPPINEQNLPF